MWLLCAGGTTPTGLTIQLLAGLSSAIVAHGTSGTAAGTVEITLRAGRI